MVFGAHAKKLTTTRQRKSPSGKLRRLQVRARGKDQRGSMTFGPCGIVPPERLAALLIDPEVMGGRWLLRPVAGGVNDKPQIEAVARFADAAGSTLRTRIVVPAHENS